ncbi:hypothetical protein P154DRAFT_561549 [Amniculicola lignicola CBS 123094]|uniref:Rhodopsin domain-containing protein n=1 Tax=Amniculicola lignicola CBS 123094 TaxID=1392246 RepID=A0A6A5WPU6_9PLEO|nr:hypothetical protein P154DRAFT_561549 [Amniculicola lignicola CBS 123094]
MNPSERTDDQFRLIVKCRSMQSLYQPEQHGICLNSQLIFLWSEVGNCILDAILVVLPIPSILKLNLPRREKIAAGAIFLLGGFVTVTSILQIVFAYHPRARRYDPLDALLWLSLRLCSAIICACLPTFRPFLFIAPRRILTKFSFGHWYGTSCSTKETKPRTPSRSRDLNKLELPNPIKPKEAQHNLSNIRYYSLTEESTYGGVSAYQAEINPLSRHSDPADHRASNSFEVQIQDKTSAE